MFTLFSFVFHSVFLFGAILSTHLNGSLNRYLILLIIGFQKFQVVGGMSDKHRLGNVTPKIEVDASMSLYEDALDESDIELNNIYTDALRYMKKQQKRKRSK